MMFFEDIEKAIIISWDPKWPKNPEKKNKTGGLRLPEFETYYKGLVIKRVVLA